MLYPVRTAHTVRLAEPDDVETLLQLCAEHAAFEHAPCEADGKPAKLTAALFGAIPKVRAWVAILRDQMVGYATATEDFSTWLAAPFLHMDCLFVRPAHRNSGIGAVLLSTVVQYAKDRGLGEVQWQTPVWNTDAVRFYLRHGASAQQKVRFRLLIE